MFDFDRLRDFIRKAAADAPFAIERARPFVSIQEEPMQIRIAVPKDEGSDFAHWRHLHERGLIRVSNNGRPGLGKMDSRVEGLTSKGFELLELARDDGVWNSAVRRCRDAGALTLPNVVSELRYEARKRIKYQR